MPEPLKIYLDQMLRLDVAQALRSYKASSTILREAWLPARRDICSTFTR